LAERVAMILKCLTVYELNQCTNPDSHLSNQPVARSNSHL